MNEFVTMEYLSTFTGMALAVGLIVQFTKSLVKRAFADEMVRVYAFLWALLIVAAVNWQQGLFTGDIVSAVLLTLINAVTVTLAAIGGYDVLAHKG